MTSSTTPYPVTFSVSYPDHPLDRFTTFFRPIVAIPICILLAAVSGGTTWQTQHGRTSTAAAAGGLLFFAPLVMILFRRKYPRWWFNWNQELLRFSNRVEVYLTLMSDRYPSTDDQQSVTLDYPYPDVERDLNRWMPLVKWFLAIPHFIVLVFLTFGAMIAVLIAWFAILFTQTYPRPLFNYVEGVIRWWNRVIAYAIILVTDQYPPFSLSQ